MNVLQYYDKQFKLWVCYLVADDNQIGECEYYMSKQRDVEVVKKWLMIKNNLVESDIES